MGLDARCLADCPAPDSTPVEALARYEAVRQHKTAAVVYSNRLGGPEGVIDAVKQRAPAGFEDIEQVLPHAEREAIVHGHAHKAGFLPCATDAIYG